MRQCSRVDKLKVCTNEPNTRSPAVGGSFSTTVILVSAPAVLYDSFGAGSPSLTASTPAGQGSSGQEGCCRPTPAVRLSYSEIRIADIQQGWKDLEH
jgi:hypothetical protein